MCILLFIMIFFCVFRLFYVLRIYFVKGYAFTLQSQETESSYQQWGFFLLFNRELPRYTEFLFTCSCFFVVFCEDVTFITDMRAKLFKCIPKRIVESHSIEFWWHDKLINEQNDQHVQCCCCKFFVECMCIHPFRMQ